LELLDFKKEIDGLMKDVCFDVYDKQALYPRESSPTDFKFDFEEQIDFLLDGKILDIIKEKDALLLQKNALITSLEGKKRTLIKTILGKAFFLLAEKDKLLREKDIMIEHLTVSAQDEKHSSDFINVNRR
jgi:hypothetical protein